MGCSDGESGRLQKRCKESHEGLGKSSESTALTPFILSQEMTGVLVLIEERVQALSYT